MKKILHIVESFGSGVYSFLVDLINETSKEFEIIVAYGVRNETPENFIKDFDSNVKFIKIEDFTRSINLKKDIKALNEIKKVISNEKPDIIHLHSSKAGVLGRIATCGKKYKVLYNPHGFSFLKQDDSKLKRICYKTIEKMMAIVNSKCTIIGCSQGEYEEAKKLNKNSICINNGIDINILEKEIEEFPEHQMNYNKIKICTVGRIGYQKNPKMFNNIAKKFPRIQFTWIGDGELRNELKNNNVTITGWKKRKDVLKILNNNDIFILTSLWEGLPISLLEAMYMKKICIVSNCIGNRDVIVNEKNGYISKDFDSFINNIENAIKNLTYCKNNICENAFNDVVNKYNLEIMKECYKDEYKKSI